MATAVEHSARVDLAHELDFRLGDLLVSPSACKVRIGGRDQRVEPRVMEVLVVLAHAANHTVTRDELIEACWGGRFVSDDAIARVIGQLRNLARGVDPAPFVLETLPKVGFRLVTPSAEDREQDRVVAPPATPAASGRRSRRGAVGLAVLVAMLFAAAAWVAWRFVLDERANQTAAVPGEWVEVAGFQPLQGDPALKRLAVLSDDALTRALSANGVDPAPGGLAASSARLRMRATVDRDGDRFVINARIEDRNSGAVLWSRRFDRPVDNPSGFQETVASHISSVLHCGRDRARAYRGRMPDGLLALFLQACSSRRDESDAPAHFQDAERLLQAAPRLSAAHSMHAWAALRLTFFTDPTPERKAADLRQARASAERALQLDPKNAEALTVLAAVSREKGLREQEDYLRRALQLEPDLGIARDSYIWRLQMVGRFKEALGTARRAAAVDPFSTASLERLAWLQAVDGDLQASWRTQQELELIDPTVAAETRRRVAFWHEEPARALLILRGGEARSRADEHRCAETYLGGGWLGPGASRLGIPDECRFFQAEWRVRMLARSGQVDAAYREAEAAWAEVAENTIFLFYPEMKAFRRDPRFWPIAQRLGLVAYWRETNRWPDFCAEPDLPFDCRKAAAAAARGSGRWRLELAD